MTDAEIIAHRLEKVRVTLRSTFLDSQWLAMRDPSSYTTLGGIINLRPLMLGKIALFSNGVNLLNHWPVIEKERRIPWSVHAHNIALAPWTTAARNMHSTFYSTKIDNFSVEELGLYRGRWVPIPEEGIPGFSVVESEEVQTFVNLVGGQHPEVDHPILDFEVSPVSIVVKSGEDIAISLEANHNAELPVTYVLASNFISWVTISRFGTLTLSPPVNTVGTYRQNITATDGMGLEVSVALEIEVS